MAPWVSVKGCVLTGSLSSCVPDRDLALGEGRRKPLAVPDCIPQGQEAQPPAECSGVARGCSLCTGLSFCYAKNFLCAFGALSCKEWGSGILGVL